MENIKVSLSSDFGTLADIWAPLSMEDIDWAAEKVTEDYAGTAELENGELSIYVPNENDLYRLRSEFNQLAAG